MTISVASFAMALGIIAGTILEKDGPKCSWQPSQTVVHREGYDYQVATWVCE